MLINLLSLHEVHPVGQMLIGTFLLLGVALLADTLVRHGIIRLVMSGIDRTDIALSSADIRPVVRRAAHLAPALIVANGIYMVPHLPAKLVMVVNNVALAFIVVAVVTALSASLTLLNDLYVRFRDAGSRPIKGYVQVVKILLYFSGFILMVAILMEKSPLLMFSGLGAMAAVLLLVFKDTILSLVASVQLASNDMLRVGDWIEIPQMQADGDVIDIALHTVKVQNWDKTITTIPTYRLISDSFKNWRGMRESGGRRIKRAIRLDQSSVRFLTDTDKARLSKFEALRSYMAEKDLEIAAFNTGLANQGQDPINHRAMTNIGTYRAYVKAYLRAHPKLRQDMLQIARLMEPTPEGLPLEVYCFTDTVVWVEYEAIQSDIFDHLISVLPQFELRLFQSPSGHNVEQMGRQN